MGLGYGRFWRGVIFDREYKNLDDLISKSLRWFPEFKDGAKFLSSKADYRWVWRTGEELLFRTIRKDSDYWAYHGQEFPFIGWNELTKYPTGSLYELMMSCNRSSFIPADYPLWISAKVYRETGKLVLAEEGTKDAMKYLLDDIPLEVFATSNPFGVGHNWVKKKFISVAAPGEMVKRTINVFNPRTQRREDVHKYQCHIFGSYKENKYLSPEYVATLESMTDENKRKAWLHGSWDVVSGGMFDDVWDPRVHVIDPFDIPFSWRIDRSFDYGSSKPFSVGWWAESDGSDVRLADGTWMSTVRGDLFRIGEWYGCTNESNTGLRMLATQITSGIIEREMAMGIYSKVNPGPADNSIWNVDNGNSIAADMRKPVMINGKWVNGVEWLRCDKSAGSRVAGWEKCRKYLQAAKPIVDNDKTYPREHPGVFFFRNCKNAIDLFPILPRCEKNPDDVDTEAEDHIGDEIRYRIMASNIGARSGKTEGL